MSGWKGKLGSVVQPGCWMEAASGSGSGHVDGQLRARRQTRRVNGSVVSVGDEPRRDVSALHAGTDRRRHRPAGRYPGTCPGGPGPPKTSFAQLNLSSHLLTILSKIN